MSEAQKRYAKRRYREDPEFREQIKRRSKERFARLRGEGPWLMHWKCANDRCTYPSNGNYERYGGKGIRMLLTKEEAEILYKRDHAHYMKKPSLDRINNNGDYHFGNCRFVEITENRRGQ